MSDTNTIWMSAPDMASVERDWYTNGPCRWWAFHPDKGDIIVCKNVAGLTLFVEDWDGNPLPIPKSHKV